MRLETNFLQFKLNKKKKSGLFIVGRSIKDKKEKGGNEILKLLLLIFKDVTIKMTFLLIFLLFCQIFPDAGMS